MQRYYYYYKTYNVRPNGSPIGFWGSEVANSKKQKGNSCYPKPKRKALRKTRFKGLYGETSGGIS